MAKCAHCGEINPDNAGFCFSCGKAFVKKEPTPAEIAYENAKKEFEESSRVNLDKSKITYICELCGTINRIDSKRCVRCGKPRPRSEYIAALKGISKARDEQPEQPAQEVVAAAAHSLPEPQTPIEEKPEVQEESKPAIYRYEPAATASVQTPQIIQPFVIVPYVNAAEKLWQYNPRQVYRYEPYTEAEKQAAEEPAAKSVDELIALRGKKHNKEAAPAAVRPAKTKKVRAAAFFSLLFSVLLAAALFIAPVFANSKLFEGLDIFKFIFVCINGAFDLSLPITSTLAYGSLKDFMLPAGYWVAGIFAVIIAIRSIVRLAKGIAKTKGFVLPLIAFIAVLVSAARLYLEFGTALFSLDYYGLFVIVGLALALLLTGIFGTKNSRNG